MPDQSEWNFIFLIYADLRVLSTESDSDKFTKLNDTLRRLSILSDCNLFTIKNTVTINNIEDKVIVRDEFICEQYVNGVEKPSFKPEAATRMDDKPKIIGNYLKQIRDFFPSKKNALFTWDHGNIFGINKVANSKALALIDLKIGDVDVFPDYNFFINPLLYRQTNGIDKDNFLTNILEAATEPSSTLSRFAGKRNKKKDDTVEPEINMLTNEMLADSLVLGGFGNERKVDVLCMMNCCMQNLHTQFAVKDVVKFLVAPQTWIYFPGYDYESIFNKIIQKKPSSIDGFQLAELIIESCYTDSIQTTPLVKQIQSEGIFSINLDNIKSVTDSLLLNFDFDFQLSLKDEVHKDKIATLFQYSFKEFEDIDFVNYRLVDLLEVFMRRSDKYSPAYPVALIQNSCDLFTHFGKDKKRFIGDNVCTLDEEEISGLTMSLPAFDTYNDPNALFIQLFFKKSKYQSKLVEHLKLDAFFDTIYS